MRTTLNIADDVLLAVKERASREKRTAGEVLSDLARSALIGQPGEPSDSTDSFFGFSPLPRNGRAVSNEIINRIRDEEQI